MSHTAPLREALIPRNPATAPEHWVDAYGDCLFRYALARVANRERAEDLVQETLLAALQGRHQFAGRCSERTWLVGILKHKIADHYRKTGRERCFNESDLLPGEEEPFRDSGAWTGHWKREQAPAPWDASPQDVVEKEEFWCVVREALAELPPRMASAFSMREIEGMSTEEICKVLDVSATNLWVMLHRARLQLRRRLEVRWFTNAQNQG